MRGIAYLIIFSFIFNSITFPVAGVSVVYAAETTSGGGGSKPRSTASAPQDPGVRLTKSSCPSALVNSVQEDKENKFVTGKLGETCGNYSFNGPRAAPVFRKITSGTQVKSAFEEKYGNRFSDATKNAISGCGNLSAVDQAAVATRFYNSGAMIEEFNLKVADEVSFIDALIPGQNSNDFECTKMFPRLKDRCPAQVKEKCTGNKEERMKDLAKRTMDAFNNVKKAQAKLEECKQAQGCRGASAEICAQRREKLKNQCSKTKELEQIILVNKANFPWLDGAEFQKNIIAQPKVCKPRAGCTGPVYKDADGFADAIKAQLLTNRKALIQSQKQSVQNFRCLIYDNTDSNDKCDYNQIRKSLSEMRGVTSSSDKELDDFDRLRKGIKVDRDGQPIDPKSVPTQSRLEKDIELQAYQNIESCYVEQGEAHQKFKKEIGDATKQAAIDLAIVVGTAGLGSVATGARVLSRLGRFGNVAKKGVTLSGVAGGDAYYATTSIKNAYEKCKAPASLQQNLSASDRVKADICEDPKSPLAQAKLAETSCTTDLLWAAVDGLAVGVSLGTLAKTGKALDNAAAAAKATPSTPTPTPAPAATPTPAPATSTKPAAKAEPKSTAEVDPKAKPEDKGLTAAEKKDAEFFDDKPKPKEEPKPEITATPKVETPTPAVPNAQVFSDVQVPAVMQPSSVKRDIPTADGTVIKDARIISSKPSADGKVEVTFQKADGSLGSTVTTPNDFGRANDLAMYRQPDGSFGLTPAKSQAQAPAPATAPAPKPVTQAPVAQTPSINNRGDYDLYQPTSVVNADGRIIQGTPVAQKGDQVTVLVRDANGTPSTITVNSNNVGNKVNDRVQFRQPDGTFKIGVSPAAKTPTVAAKSSSLPDNRLTGDEIINLLSGGAKSSPPPKVSTAAAAPTPTPAPTVNQSAIPTSTQFPQATVVNSPPAKVTIPTPEPVVAPPKFSAAPTVRSSSNGNGSALATNADAPTVKSQVENKPSPAARSVASNPNSGNVNFGTQAAAPSPSVGSGNSFAGFSPSGANDFKNAPSVQAIPEKGVPTVKGKVDSVRDVESGRTIRMDGPDGTTKDMIVMGQGENSTLVVKNSDGKIEKLSVEEVKGAEIIAPNMAPKTTPAIVKTDGPSMPNSIFDSKNIKPGGKVSGFAGTSAPEVPVNVTDDLRFGDDVKQVSTVDGDFSGRVVEPPNGKPTDKIYIKTDEPKPRVLAFEPDEIKTAIVTRSSNATPTAKVAEYKAPEVSVKTPEVPVAKVDLPGVNEGASLKVDGKIVDGLLVKVDPTSNQLYLKSNTDGKFYPMDEDALKKSNALRNSKDVYDTPQAGSARNQIDLLAEQSNRKGSKMTAKQRENAGADLNLTPNQTAAIDYKPIASKSETNRLFDRVFGEGKKDFDPEQLRRTMSFNPRGGYVSTGDFRNAEKFIEAIKKADINPNSLSISDKLLLNAYTDNATLYARQVNSNVASIKPQSLELKLPDELAAVPAVKADAPAAPKKELTFKDESPQAGNARNELDRLAENSNRKGSKMTAQQREFAGMEMGFDANKTAAIDYQTVATKKETAQLFDKIFGSGKKGFDPEQLRQSMSFNPRGGYISAGDYNNAKDFVNAIKNTDLNKLDLSVSERRVLNEFTDRAPLYARQIDPSVPSLPRQNLNVTSFADAGPTDVVGSVLLNNPSKARRGDHVLINGTDYTIKGKNKDGSFNVVDQSGYPKKFSNDEVVAAGVTRPITKELITNSKLSDPERIAAIEKQLGRPLSPSQRQAMIDAHNVGSGGLFNYTDAENFQKLRGAIKAKADPSMPRTKQLTPDEAKLLADKGLIGNPPTLVNQVDNLADAKLVKQRLPSEELPNPKNFGTSGGKNNPVINVPVGVGDARPGKVIFYSQAQKGVERRYTLSYVDNLGQESRVIVGEKALLEANTPSALRQAKIGEARRSSFASKSTGELERIVDDNVASIAKQKNGGKNVDFNDLSLDAKIAKQELDVRKIKEPTAAIPFQAKNNKISNSRSTPELEKKVDAYINSLKGSDLTEKEIRSVAHQEDLIAASRNADVSRIMDDAKVDFEGMKFGMLDSDVGKEVKFQENLLIKPTKESDELLNGLRGKGNTAASKEITDILSDIGYKNPHMMNPNLTNQEIRDIISEVPALRGYLHEMPGMQLAIRDFNNGTVTAAQFRERFLANLGHNGPDAGFWGKLSDEIIPGGLANAKNPKAKELFKNTIFEGKTLPNGVVKPVYPEAVTPGAIVHLVMDRLSQGTRGGIGKIFYELGGGALQTNRQIPVGQIGFPPNKGLGLPNEMLFGNPEKTLQQLNKRRTQTLNNQQLTSTQKRELNKLLDGASERIKKQNQFVKENVQVIKNADGSIEKINLKYIDENGNPQQRTFTNDTPSETVANEMDNLLKHEERLNGEPFKDFKAPASEKRSALAATSTKGEEPRLQNAEEVLGRKLDDIDQKAIVAAHNVGNGQVGKNGKAAGVGNYTKAQLKQKAEILRENGFTSAEIRKLMENKIVGSEPEKGFFSKLFGGKDTSKDGIAQAVNGKWPKSPFQPEQEVKFLRGDKVTVSSGNIKGKFTDNGETFYFIEFTEDGFLKNKRVREKDLLAQNKGPVVQVNPWPNSPFQPSQEVKFLRSDKTTVSSGKIMGKFDEEGETFYYLEFTEGGQLKNKRVRESELLAANKTNAALNREASRAPAAVYRNPQQLFAGQEGFQVGADQIPISPRSVLSAKGEKVRFDVASDQSFRQQAVKDGRLKEFSVGEKANLPAGEYTYLITRDGKMVVGRLSDNFELGVKHFNLANGREVVTAGELRVLPDGNFDYNLESGTYTRQIVQSVPQSKLQSQTDEALKNYLAGRGNYSTDVIAPAKAPSTDEIKKACSTKSFLTFNMNSCCKMVNLGCN